MEKKKPRVFIAMPCYDNMKVETCVSLLNTYAVLAKSGVECIFKSVKSSLVTHARNLLTAGFMASDYDYMLCVAFATLVVYRSAFITGARIISSISIIVYIVACFARSSLEYR